MVEGPTPLLLSAKISAETSSGSGKAWFPDGGNKPLQLERSNYHLLLPVTGFAGNTEVIKALQTENEEEIDDAE